VRPTVGDTEGPLSCPSSVDLRQSTATWFQDRPNHRHLLHALREFEAHYNTHRPHQGVGNARPLASLPEPIANPDRLARLNIHRRDRLGGILHEYQHAA
jgi:hypothetical protein